MIPLFDTSYLDPLKPQLEERFRAVLDSGVYVLGPELEAFEREFANYLGVKHVIGVGNGTDAIVLALKALGVGPGDDVVVPSFTFFASVEPIVAVGARPVFCDIDLETFCVNADTVEAALTKNTKAVIAVDLFGNPTDVENIERNVGLPVIEDAAQAAGSTLRDHMAGSRATISTFSFYPSKNLGCFGDGGAVATNDSWLAVAIRQLRSHGTLNKGVFERFGCNSRLDEVQAALLRVTLSHLGGWTYGRAITALHYQRAGLSDIVAVPKSPSLSDPAWHLYVIRHREIHKMAAKLALAEIGHRTYYRTPVHRQPALSDYTIRDAPDLPATNEAARTHLAIPMSPVLRKEQAEAVVAALRD